MDALTLLSTIIVWPHFLIRSPFYQNFAACIGESSTDPHTFEYQTLECEMETVKEKIETIIVENQSLKHELSTLEKSGVGNVCGAQTKVKNVEVETQTLIVGSVSLDVEMKDNVKCLVLFSF
jgi:hypothetical protein